MDLLCHEPLSMRHFKSTRAYVREEDEKWRNSAERSEMNFMQLHSQDEQTCPFISFSNTFDESVVQDGEERRLADARAGVVQLPASSVSRLHIATLTQNRAQATPPSVRAFVSRHQILTPISTA